jgi:F-type H+-transporting ATPase subunit a
MVSRKKLLLAAILVLAASALAANGLAGSSQHAEPAPHEQQAATPAAQAESHEAPAGEAGAAHGEAQGEAQGEAHGAGHGEESGVAHLANLVGIAAGFFHDAHGQPTAVARFLLRFLDPIFSGVTAILLLVFFARVYVRRSLYPGRWQMLAELLVGGLFRLFEIILGPEARRFAPYLGTLFLFILVNNLLGLIPLLHSSTSGINTTAALAICTFFYVQGIGIKENGLLGYLHHMAGSPRSPLEWGFSLLLFPLHVLGEFIKPLSLSLRLFGNIFGEDALVATMVVLGAGLFAGAHIPFGLPLQFPFVFLAMLTSTIQALVFALLSTVYIALMLPHEDHEEAHGH